MQPIWLARVFFILIMTWSGYWLGRSNKAILEFTGVGLLFSIFIVVVEHSSRILSAKKIALSVLGAFFGLAFARLFSPIVPSSLFSDPEIPQFAFSLLFMYFGIVMAMRQADRISLSRLRVFIGGTSDNSILLDTSAIIDGRIVKLYELGFMTRSSIVPTFVLDELQLLADSRDADKRNYGRRGLENLEELRTVDRSLQIFEKDYPDIKGGVDHKLIALAKEIGSTLVSNDYNLCKIASLHQVKSFNIVQLAAALRPNLSIGDHLALVIQREGKEEGQGVGHLEDGTMVVVERGRSLIGQQVNVTIISIVQTNAGRLVFARIPKDYSQTDEDESSGPPPKKSARIEAVN